MFSEDLVSLADRSPANSLSWFPTKPGLLGLWGGGGLVSHSSYVFTRSPIHVPLVYPLKPAITSLATTIFMCGFSGGIRVKGYTYACSSPFLLVVQDIYQVQVKPIVCLKLSISPLSTYVDLVWFIICEVVSAGHRPSLSPYFKLHTSSPSLECKKGWVVMHFSNLWMSFELDTVWSSFFTSILMLISYKLSLK